jgi:hypothetical protein
MSERLCLLHRPSGKESGKGKGPKRRNEEEATRLLNQGQG